MSLRYSFPLRLTIKTYLLALLLVLLAFSFTFTPISKVWANILLIWSVGTILDLGLNIYKKRLVHWPDSVLITAIIIVGVIATGTKPLFVILAVFVAILSKHFLTIKARHIFNPANLALLLAVYLFNQNIEWWVASNLWIIVLGGIFIAWKQRRLEQPLVFLAVYLVFKIVLQGAFNISSIRSEVFYDYSLYFFAFVMVAEPRTAPWNKQGRLIAAGATAVFALIFNKFNIQASFIVSLATVNALTPLLNNYTSKISVNLEKQPPSLTKSET